MSSKSADLRPALRETYLYVVNNWAVGTAEVASNEGRDLKDTERLLRRLERKGLLVAEHVNGEKAVTWQSYFDIHNEDEEADAIKAFNEAFPEGIVVPVGRTLTKGATGPRYTPEQIKKGLAARKAGKRNAEVAAAAGVKSPSYFAKTLKGVEAEQAAKPKCAYRDCDRAPGKGWTTCGKHHTAGKSTRQVVAKKPASRTAKEAGR